MCTDGQHCLTLGPMMSLARSKTGSWQLPRTQECCSQQGTWQCHPLHKLLVTLYFTPSSIMSPSSWLAYHFRNNILPMEIRSLTHSLKPAPFTVKFFLLLLLLTFDSLSLSEPWKTALERMSSSSRTGNTTLFHNTPPVCLSLPQ